MTFSELLEDLRRGKYLRRNVWPDSWFIYLEEGFEFEVTAEGCRPAITKGTIVTQEPLIMLADSKTNKLKVFEISTSDILAADWELIDC